MIGRFFSFSIAAPGDASTVDVAAPGPSFWDPDGYTAIHGPEFRAVFDLADPNNSNFILAPGEPGNIVSAHATNLMQPWRDGATFKLTPTTTTATLTLIPGP